MRSKAFHAFEQKLIYFNDDLDTIDVLRTSVINNDLTDPTSKLVLKNIDPTKHKHLSRRKNADGSRLLIINHLRSTVYSSYVKDVYEEVTFYLKTILEKAAENGFDPGRIVGEHTFKIDATKILSSGNWKDMSKFVTESVFQSLESEKSTLKLLEKVSKKLNLSVDSSLIVAALPYLEIRHFLIHADGVLGHEFKLKFPHIHHRDGYVQLDLDFIENFRSSICSLIADYDAKIIDANLLRPEDTQP